MGTRVCSRPSEGQWTEESRFGARSNHQSSSPSGVDQQQPANRATHPDRTTGTSRTNGNRPKKSDLHGAKGDMLERIARRELGDGRRANEIFEMNRDQLSSPDDIQPGMVLKLPEWSQFAPSRPTHSPWKLGGGCGHWWRLSSGATAGNPAATPRDATTGTRAASHRTPHP